MNKQEKGAVSSQTFEDENNKNEMYCKYGEDSFQLYPRDEYQTLFVGTSAFEMSSPNYWSTYFRSLSTLPNGDRLTTLVEKTFTNDRVNDDEGGIEMGAFKSPFESRLYRTIFRGKKSEKYSENTFEDASLYDKMLQYRLKMYKIIMDEFKADECKNIRIFQGIDYPYPLVRVKTIENLTTEQNNLYEIVLVYFAGITNRIAHNKGIPIEMVLRASFGHNIPCLADIATGFRISIGICPEAYAKIIAAALHEFNDKFQQLLEEKLNFEKYELDLINENIDSYNKRQQSSNVVEFWQADDTVFELLCKVGDSSGRKVAYQLMRQRKNINLLCNYIHEELIYGKGNLITPLKRLLKLMKFGEEVNMNTTDSDYKFERIPFKEVDEQVKSDEQFWAIFKEMSLAFESRKIYNLRDAVENRQVIGLYSLIEEANVEFITNSSDQLSEDESGSDSECEVVDYDDDRTYYSKKLTLTTGMRAITLTQFLVKMLTKTMNNDTDYAYYEVEPAIKQVLDVISELNLTRNCDEHQEVIRHIDLNHRSSIGEDLYPDLFQKIRNEIAQEKQEVIILDHTATTTDKISEAIKMFAPIVRIVFLVGSGLKNEQIGADMNPYGVIRILTEDKVILNGLYEMVKISVAGKEKMPKQLHDVRRAFKSVGATLTSKAIFTKENGWKFEKKARHDEKKATYDKTTDLRSFSKHRQQTDFSERFTKVYELCFNYKYKNELKNLIDIHKQNFNDIIDWDIEKILFLGSNQTKEISEKGIDFNCIKSCYEKDREMARKIFNEDNIDLYRDKSYFQKIIYEH